jgi:hypothetical protein
MPRKTTAATIAKLRAKGDGKRYEPVARKVLTLMLEGALILEEQPLDDDGIHEVHEYFGQHGDMEISSQRLKKHNGINPRFNLKIVNGSTEINIGGQFAAKAYSMANLSAREDENEVSDDEVGELLEALG